MKNSKRSLPVRVKPLLLAILVLCVVSCETPIKEQTITLSQDELMVIYKNGYLKGKLNVIEHSKDGLSEKVWEIDSLNLSSRFFK